MKAIHKPTLVKISILFLFLIVLVPSLDAQTVLLKRETERDTIERKFGKNKKFYAGLFLGYGFVVGKETPGLPIQYGSSSELVLGIWGKRKLFGRNGFGLLKTIARPSPIPFNMNWSGTHSRLLMPMRTSVTISKPIKATISVLTWM
jgi:hypothetical protein